MKVDEKKFIFLGKHYLLLAHPPGYQGPLQSHSNSLSGLEYRRLLQVLRDREPHTAQSTQSPQPHSLSLQLLVVFVTDRCHLVLVLTLQFLKNQGMQLYETCRCLVCM